MLGVVGGTEDSLFVLADSDTGGVEIDDVQSVAQAALATRRTARATEPTRLGRQALVAEPLIENGAVRGVVVLADGLGDVQDNVSLIQRRILVAGAIAFLIAVLGGYLVARALSLRIERLERAARKVAAGDFSDRIEPDSDDELGQLGAAFDDMSRQLQRLDHARKQFIAQASHELRTPLFSLGGFLELLEDEELDEDTRRQFLDHVRAQVERLSRLATELLDLSRLEAGALELRTEPTDVHQLARDVAGEFTPMAAQRRLRAARRARRRGDRDRVRPGARRAGGSYPARQRPAAHARGDRSASFRLPARTGRSGSRSPTPASASAARPCPTSSSRSSPPPTARRAPGLGLAIARELAERMSGELSVRSCRARPPSR